MDIQIKEFAPVIIPTLCRYEHLKRLLESLEKCKYADKTEVYVAVDYPAKECHRPGYEKIIEYLDKSNFNFKFFNVIYRERNYGLGNDGNHWLLLKEVSKKHSKYIFTEDDNEFSPNFLEYMNLNLEKYENDHDILFICGYSSKDLNIKSEFSQYSTSKKFAAWGFGAWLKKMEIFEDEQIFDKLLKSPEIKEFTKSHLGKTLYLSLVNMSKGGPKLGDVMYVSYMRLNNRKSIFPIISKVRNHGWDGSGTHGGYVPGYSTQIIDANYDYSINEAPNSLTKEIENKLKENSHSKPLFIDKMLVNSSFYLYKTTGIYWNLDKFKKRVKKILRKA